LNYKKEQKSRERERERERAYNFCVKKYGLNRKNNIKFIQNKIGKNESKYKKEKRIKEVQQ